ncbi:hypothetical protein [Aliikangiella sp. G2MR2-5]|uniref:hypothetical protein n=1 Tax=Aliikangiella sp. G2MR2-5 TaxID=2788943 RepID=UPI0018AA8D73|nr:hypothetical protein [Aliikangiella sp. G2MR2-5]
MANSVNIKQALMQKFLFSILICYLSIGTVLAENILVVRGKSSAFEEVTKGMSDDLEGEFEISQLIIDNASSPNEIKKSFDKSPPSLVVLMGNKAVNLYGKFQAESKNKSFPPAIAVAALFIDKFISNIENATAIRYEIPAVTSAVAMRSILGKPINKIGVIYREWMTDIINENKRFCEAEGIELVGIKLPNKVSDTDKEVKNALAQLSKQVDAIWILNDNNLLTRDALAKAWLPSRTKSKLPAIVGVKIFLQKIPLGSFAIVPDDYGMGAQLAGIIFEVQDNDWELDSGNIMQPYSVKKFVNLSTLKNKGIAYIENQLRQVDEIVK